MKKKYKGFPLDRPHPALGDKVLWEPQLLVRLGKKGRKYTPRFPAIVDSGSPFCIFKEDVASFLGIDIEKGEESKVGGVIAGVFQPIYFHRVQLYVESDWVVNVRAGFVKKLSTSGILGRTGFFDNFVVTFDHSQNPPCLEITRIQAPN